MNKIIQGLWIGPELSVMEQLSISSFLRNGHEYHLYVYDEPKNIPAGTVVMDAADVLPASRIFQYKHFPTYAGFANFFRYKLLLERGGWWADTDVVCLKPFDFPQSHVFATEQCNGHEVVTSGIIKVPRGSHAMAYAWEVCQLKDPDKLGWGETGPRLMGDVVQRFSLNQYCQPFHTFCPLDYLSWRQVLETDWASMLDDESYAIHLWNERWRASGQDKNAKYPEECFYEILKRRYLPAATAAAHSQSAHPTRSTTIPKSSA